HAHRPDQLPVRHADRCRPEAGARCVPALRRAARRAGRLARRDERCRDGVGRLIRTPRPPAAMHAVHRAAAVALALAIAAACDAPGASERPATPPPAERDADEGTGGVAPDTPDSIVDGEHATSGNVGVRLYFFTG